MQPKHLLTYSTITLLFKVLLSYRPPLMLPCSSPHAPFPLLLGRLLKFLQRTQLLKLKLAKATFLKPSTPHLTLPEGEAYPFSQNPTPAPILTSKLHPLYLLYLRFTLRAKVFIGKPHFRYNFFSDLRIRNGIVQMNHRVFFKRWCNTYLLLLNLFYVQLRPAFLGDLALEKEISTLN
jgi:hypothetical protein